MRQKKASIGATATAIWLCCAPVIPGCVGNEATHDTSGIGRIYTLFSEGDFDESLNVTNALLNTATRQIDLDSLDIHRRYLILRGKVIEPVGGSGLETPERCDPVEDAFFDNPYVGYEMLLGNVMYALSTSATDTAIVELEKLFFQTTSFLQKQDAVSRQWLLRYINDVEDVVLLLCHRDYRHRSYVMFANYLSRMALLTSPMDRAMILRAGRAYAFAAYYSDAANYFLIGGLGRELDQFPEIDRKTIASYYLLYMRSLFSMREWVVIKSLYAEYSNLSSIFNTEIVDPYMREEFFLLQCLGLVATGQFEEGRAMFFDLLQGKRNVGAQYYRNMAYYLQNLCLCERQLRDRIQNIEPWKRFLSDCAAIDPGTFEDVDMGHSEGPAEP